MGETIKEGVPIIPLTPSDRITKLHSHFSANFKKTPEFFVRVPGRVNLIGEHIDYCGYGVCPMALEQDILVAVAINDQQDLHLTNTDSKFSNFKCDVNDFHIRVVGPPEWYQYFLCGIKGILETLTISNSNIKGFYAAIDGTIPQSAGLSSSSALVSAAALVTAYIHDNVLSKTEIADLCAQAERFIGTQGGGMDQAIAFLATQGCAKFIEFSPLRSKDVSLPTNAVFVIAHSIGELNKAATSDFNCRVVECRLATQILAKLEGVEWKNIQKLGQLQQLLNVDLNNMITKVKNNLHQFPYRREEIVKILQITDTELDQLSLTPNTRHLREFKLHQRALHVFQEALRVQQFHDISESTQGDEALTILGRLMTESHQSLKDLYECSHPLLDKLVDLSKNFTFGARLTGAGWGGCIVALLHPTQVSNYINLLKSEYYNKHINFNGNVDSILFATAPNAGACIFI